MNNLWNVPQGRSRLKPWQWQEIKGAIDGAREFPDCDEYVETLKAYALWDNVENCPNEVNINRLYMENT